MSLGVGWSVTFAVDVRRLANPAIFGLISDGVEPSGWRQRKGRDRGRGKGRQDECQCRGISMEKEGLAVAESCWALSAPRSAIRDSVNALRHRENGHSDHPVLLALPLPVWRRHAAILQLTADFQARGLVRDTTRQAAAPGGRGGEERMPPHTTPFSALDDSIAYSR